MKVITTAHELPTSRGILSRDLWSGPPGQKGHKWFIDDDTNQCDWFASREMTNSPSKAFPSSSKSKEIDTHLVDIPTAHSQVTV